MITIYENKGYFMLISCNNKILINILPKTLTEKTENSTKNVLVLLEMQ